MDPLPQLVVLPSVLGGILARLGLYPEMEMVEEAQCFDCVDDSNPAVLDAYQVITILLLAAGCQIRRAGENDRALSIEVRHDELVMDHIGKFSCVAVPSDLKGSGAVSPRYAREAGRHFHQAS